MTGRTYSHSTSDGKKCELITLEAPGVEIKVTEQHEPHQLIPGILSQLQQKKV